MSRVLFLTQVLPYPLDAGPKVRAHHMLCRLSERHEVTLATFVRPDDAPESIDHLRGVCHSVYPIPMRRSLARNVCAALKGLATGLPIVIARDEIREMADTLRRLARATPFDVIHADQLSMAGYGQLAAAANGRRRPRTLLDEHNAVYLLARRMADTTRKGVRRAVTAREARAFARYEASMCRAYDAVLCVTAEDRDHLLALFPAEEQAALADKLTVVPICVDPAQIPPVTHRDSGTPTILHIGTMFWPPNISGVLWFANEVLPLIHDRVPDARFVVVGKSPTPEVRALSKDPRIEITGYVDDTTPYLEAADAFVVPLHAAGGMRVKILDAWLWGLPIVSTPIGAEGIAVRDGENIFIAGDPAGLAQATVSVLTDAACNRRLRANGRAWVEAHYAWQQVYERVDRVYDRLLEGYEHRA